LGNARQLSREQLRVIDHAAKRGEPVALSAITLVEIALIASGREPALHVPLAEFLEDLNSNPAFRILPITGEVALEVAALGPLKDSADRIIAATARVHRLKLVTSDQRIIDSGLVSVIE
jgi:PIN domain nuclease of toxin-antitoxin system